MVNGGSGGRGNDDRSQGDEGEQSGDEEGVQGIKADHKRTDMWLSRGRDLMWVRQHGESREAFFNPEDATRGPTSSATLWSLRKTEGTMADGRKFSVTDEWDSRSGKERRMRQSWTGTTTFICRTPTSRLDKMSNHH